MEAVSELADRQAFLRDMQQHADPGAEELARLSALWPAAHEAAVACLALMPGIGFLSLKRRERAFLAISDALDARVAHGGLDPEQAQLALAILRSGSRRFRKAEAAFVARLGRRDRDALARLSGTARNYLHALRVMQDRRRPAQAKPR
jgi:hypothetical protein